MRVQPGQEVVGAAQLERADPLEILALQEDASAGLTIQGRGGEQQGPVTDPVEAPMGSRNLFRSNG